MTENLPGTAATPERDDWDWLIPLLTEASAACNGNLSVLGIRAAIKNVPDEILDGAGLQWARRSFDDDAPTLAQVAKWESGNGRVQPPPRLVITPKEPKSD